MIIEFLGVSGVGKTTVAKRLRSKLEENGREVVWDTYDLYASHGWLTRNIRKGWFVIKYAAGHRSWVRGYRAFLSRNILKKAYIKEPLFNGIYLKSLLEKARLDHKVHIFDEGALQYLWAVKLRGISTVSNLDMEDIEKYLGLPDEVIVVEAAAGTIASRLEKRGQYVRIMKDGDLKETITKMQIVQRNIVYNLNDSVKVKYINNDFERKQDRKAYEDTN